MNKALVEDLGEGQWLIIPTGEIKKCSRSTAYRIAKKANEAVVDKEKTQPFLDEGIQEVEILDEPVYEIEAEESESPNTTDRTMQTANIVEGDTKPIFDLPSLEDLNGGGDGGDSDIFLEEDGEVRDEEFINTLKNAEIVEDDEGNRKVRLGDILIGNNPLILTMLRSCDSSIYGWAKNKHGIDLWDEGSRSVQRAFFVKMLGMVSPKMSVELDPKWIIITMLGWLYGVPMIKILKTRKPKQKKIDKYVNQKPVVVLDE